MLKEQLGTHTWSSGELAHANSVPRVRAFRESVALYLFVIALPLLITAALLSEFTAFGEARTSGESLAVCFFVAGYFTALVALALVLASLQWTYALALGLPSIIGFFTIRYALRNPRP